MSHEACALAGHLRLGKLVVLYDDNQISIDGKTDLSFSEDVLKRFEAYGWHTQRIDGHDHDAIDAAITAAKAHAGQPSIIACKTLIGFGSPNRQGTSKAHGEPLGGDEAALTKAALGIPATPAFFVPEGLAAFTREHTQRGRTAEQAWRAALDAFGNAQPEQAARYQAAWSGEVSDEALDIPAFAPGKAATRNASGDVLNYLAPRIPALMGGSADLTPSNKTFAKGEHSFSADTPTGRYVHYGVREHGMAAVMNGMALHGGVISYAGTFFVFTDYMRAAMRMSALMGLRVIYVLTHDSIGLGEDGPTHQPEAHLSSFRAMPNMPLLRPMDANETLVAWQVALRRKGPSGLVLTRQNLPTYDRAALGMAPASEAAKDGYVLLEGADFDTILMASGSEVEIMVQAHAMLQARGHKVRLVSMPCTDIFDQQSAEYREAVLPKAVRRRVSIEAGATSSWYKYVGLDGTAIGMDRYGAWAPYERLYEEFGLTAEAVVAAVEALA